MSSTKCPECGCYQKHGWDLITCMNCGAELGSTMPNGEPVRNRPLIENIITDPRQLAAPIQQAIAFVKGATCSH